MGLKYALRLLVIGGLVVVVFVCWCGAAYIRLERMRVALHDSRARLLAAERRRIDLSKNLIRNTDGLACLTDDDRARILSAAAALEQAMLRSESLSDDAGAYLRFRQARGRLDHGLQATWPVLSASGTTAAVWLLESLRPSVDAASREASARLGGFDRALSEFRTERARFPSSFVAAIGRPEIIDGAGVARVDGSNR